MSRPLHGRPIGSDTAHDGGMSHHEIGRILGCSHTRVQQVEAVAMAKLARGMGIDPKDVIPRVRAAMLTHRIQRSSCRLCGSAGHNRATCPRKNDAKAQHVP